MATHKIDNPNPDNFFYSEKEMKAREEYIPVVKEKILKKLEDLKKKIETDEPYPEKNQNVDDLSDIDSSLEEILNKWYY